MSPSFFEELNRIAALPHPDTSRHVDGADHDRALAFVRRWLSEPLDSDQHPEWLNLARAYAQAVGRAGAGK